MCSRVQKEDLSTMNIFPPPHSIWVAYPFHKQPAMIGKQCTTCYMRCLIKPLSYDRDYSNPCLMKTIRTQRHTNTYTHTWSKVLIPSCKHSRQHALIEKGVSHPFRYNYIDFFDWKDGILHLCLDQSNCPSISIFFNYLRMEILGR